MFTFISLLLCVTTSVHCLGCVNHLGESVDWWLGIKMPSPHGTRYVAIEPGMVDWYAGNDITGPLDNHLANTLQPLYRQNDTAFMLYNDETPPSDGGHVDFVRAHAKGVLGLGEQNGFWLVHSVPKFPNNPSDSEGYLGVLPGQQKYAQSFLCLSMNGSDLNEIADVLHEESLSFFSDVHDGSPTIWNSYPKLKQVLSATPLPREEFIFKTFQTSAGEIVTAISTPSTLIAHGTGASFDLYNYIAQSFQTSLKVSTWPNEHDRQPSYCPVNDSLSVENVHMVSVDNISWLSHMDHSKIAMSDSSSRPVTCIGDKNRSLHQLLRGGGSVCMFRKDVWQLFDAMIVSTESCPMTTSL